MSNRQVKGVRSKHTPAQESVGGSAQPLRETRANRAESVANIGGLLNSVAAEFSGDAPRGRGRPGGFSAAAARNFRRQGLAQFVGSLGYEDRNGIEALETTLRELTCER
jgi:hypothetical protein